MRLPLLLATLGAASAAAAQQAPPLDSAVVALMRASSVPGVAIAIVRGDSVELHGFGMARVADGAPVDPRRTLFRLASVAKLFVAASAAQQLDRGALALDAPVNRYLDGWRTADDVTVLHLLTHTAGLDERLIGYAAPSLEKLEPLGEHLRRRLPRQGWRAGELTGYSNYGMALAGYLVERVSGLEYAEYARRALFLPLGMTRTFYRAVPESLAADRASAHRCGGDGCQPLPDLYSHPYPVGLAYSTAADMGRFVRALLGQGPADSVLDPRARAELFRERFRNEPTVPGISLGFFNQRHRGLPILAHSGSVPGTSGLLVVAPSRRVGFYFVANGGRSAFGAALRDTLLDRLLPDLATTEPTPAETVALPAAWLDRLAGPYLLTRYSHATVERFPMLFGAVVDVTRGGDGVALPMDGGRRRFLPVDSLHFREEGGERVLAFRRDPRGRVTDLFAPAPVFGAEYPAALERLAWHDAPHFMNEYLSG
ncbi:MAG: serine hydrolase domain-containing protein [Gemmatimonadales bacterium]